MQLEVRLALTLTLSSRERETTMAMLGTSLNGEHLSSGGKSFSLSPGERAGVRASINSN